MKKLGTNSLVIAVLDGEYHVARIAVGRQARHLLAVAGEGESRAGRQRHVRRRLERGADRGGGRVAGHRGQRADQAEHALVAGYRVPGGVSGRVVRGHHVPVELRLRVLGLRVRAANIFTPFIALPRAVRVEVFGGVRHRRQARGNGGQLLQDGGAGGRVRHDRGGAGMARQAHRHLRRGVADATGNRLDGEADARRLEQRPADRLRPLERRRGALTTYAVTFLIPCWAAYVAMPPRSAGNPPVHMNVSSMV